MIYEDLTALVGNTPVVKYQGLYLKLESYNPTGSVKDRPMLMMIKTLELVGKIKKGDTLIEATSGNMGISLAFLASNLGYKSCIIMPENMSVERTKIIQALGSKIVHTPSSEGMNGAINKAKELASKPGFYYLDQFHNQDNLLAHEINTAPEIIADFDKLDFFISAIGTAGTITGVSKVLKEHYPNLSVIGVEPKESAILNGFEPNRHLIQGIGAGFIPPLIDKTLIDQVEMVPSLEAIEEMKLLWKTGLFVGISSASAILVGKKILKINPKNIILIIVPDYGFKYLSVVS